MPSININPSTRVDVAAEREAPISVGTQRRADILLPVDAAPNASASGAPRASVADVARNVSESLGAPAPQTQAFAAQPVKPQASVSPVASAAASSRPVAVKPAATGMVSGYRPSDAPEAMRTVPTESGGDPHDIALLNIPGTWVPAAMSSRRPSQIGVIDAIGTAQAARPMAEQVAFDAATAADARDTGMAASRASDSADAMHGVNNDDAKPYSAFNKPFGYKDKSRQPKLKQHSRKRPASIEKSVKNRAADAFRRSGTGYRIYGKMLGLQSLDLREVGVGIKEIMAVVEQDPDMLNNLISASIGSRTDASALSPNEIADVINSNDVYVATFKEPGNSGRDAQRRKLKVLLSQQRGVYLHPFMAAMYTADFDGDDMEVSLDPEVAKLANDPMEYMVDFDGNIPLNTDFIPVSNIVEGWRGDGTGSKREYVREVIFSAFAKATDADGMGRLCDAVVRLSETAFADGDAQSEAWVDVFRAARSVSSSMRRGRAARNKMMSELCKAVFDGMHVLKMDAVLRTMDADIVGIDALPSPTAYDDSAIYAIMREFIAGEVPNNFQDLKILLNGFIGNVEGKNAPFRFSADVGKMMKFDSRLQIGDGSYLVDPSSDEQMRAFFESTVKFAASRRQAKEIKHAGRSQYYTELMRFRVIRDVGFPEMYGSYAEFLNRFVESYNSNSAIINEANLVFLANMEISSDKRSLVSPLNPSKGGVTLKDIAEPFLSIYGTCSVRRMFGSLSSRMGRYNRDPFWAGNPEAPARSKKHTAEWEYNHFGDSGFWITGKYIDYNLRQFVHENRLLRGKSDSRVDIKSIGSRRISSLGSDDISDQFEMLLVLADKRTGTASKFNKSVYGYAEGLGIDDDADANAGRSANDEKTAVQMMSELLCELERMDRAPERRDQSLWADDIISVLIESGPDIFNHFNMDSPAGFLSSDWARKMIEHSGDTEVLGGIRTAMVFDYRMERVNALMSSLPDPGSDPSGYQDAYSNLEFALDELSASSEVWRGIIKELKAEATPSQKSVFQMMASGETPMHANATGTGSYAWALEYWDARRFWENPGDHATLLSVINDLDLDRTTKWNVIADVVRYWEKDVYLKSYEVGFQLEIGNDVSYSLGSSNMQSALGTYRDFQQAFNRWGRMSQENLQKNIDDAAFAWSGKPGALMGAIARLDASPWELVSIDDMMYADSILSVMDRTYAQSEKSSQHPWTNASYSALSFQRNGGFYNDITRTDDRLLGIQSADSLGIQDIVHLLANPDASLTVYNSNGETGILSRKAMLENALLREVQGDGSESDIWEFLRQEPRIASAIRMHSACVMADMDGRGWIGATLGTKETIRRMVSGAPNAIDHVKYLMRDHPAYAGIVSLATPAYGSVTRNSRTRIAAMENYLAGMLYRYASDTGVDSVEAAEAILSDLGITSDGIRDVMRSDYDKFCELLGLPTVHDSGIEGDGLYSSDDDADFTLSVAMSSLARYVEEIRGKVPLGRPTAEARRPDAVGIDISSVASFWDVLQELGGAKTAISTGVEGSETYKFAEWVSHITAKDRYADLEAVYDDVDRRWNGAWTNIPGPDGSPMLLSVDDDGTISNYNDIIDAKDALGYDEVVVLVPDGYTVRGRAVDSYGNPESSLFMYMVSKRSNGAETFNLKAKKSGLDGSDSVTKMQGKRKTVFDDDGSSHEVGYIEVLSDLRRIASGSPDGIMAAKAELARMMLDENTSLGYKDLTLSNYMSIADLMLIEGQDGQLHLRSLEMLFSAIKHRLGSSTDEMSEDDIVSAVDAIVSDNSEHGIGIASMGNPIDALDGFSPRPKSASATGIRPASSVFERNYDLLGTIEREASMNGIKPMSPAKRAQLDKRYRGIDGVDRMVDRIKMVENYSIVGYAGIDGREDRIDWTIGPSSTVIIGDGDISDGRVVEICEMAYGLGMTVIVSPRHRNAIPSDMAKDAMPCSDTGDILIPCFDMRLNGSESLPYNGGRFAVFQAPFSRYVVSVEDSANVYQLGDAQYKPTRNLVDRIHIVDNGTERIMAEDLFPNVFRNPAFANSTFEVSLASGDEISMLILDGVKCTIDYGIVEGGRGFDQRVSDVNDAIDRYRERWSEADPDGIIRGGMSECRPGDIVGWAEIAITGRYTGRTQYVLAPIIPFPLHGSTKNIPEVFTVEQLGYAGSDNTQFSVDWSNTSSIEGSFAKYFDSSGGANKGMIDFTDAIQDHLMLRDGTAVDAYCAKASTDSRKIGTDRRVKTMISLMALARMHGYNFARVDGAFPENAEIRDRLLSAPISSGEWRGLMHDGIRFSTDPQLDAFLRFECRKILQNGGNPSDYLACVYTDADGIERNTHVMWEFEAMFDQGLTYEDGLLRFLSSMDPGLCPSGIYDGTQDRLFRLAKDGDSLAHGYDAGVLQMQVPHMMSNGSVAYLWDNVYIGMSFFGEDYSGFSRPNIDGASNFLDAMNTMSYYGVQLDEKAARFRAMWATADLGRLPHDGGAIGKA